VRVGVNLLWLVPGDVGGSETWVRGLLGEVAAEPPPGVEVVVFATAALAEAHPYLSSFTRRTPPREPGRSRPARVALESTWLPLAARRAGVDVLHHPGGTIPPARLSPPMVTIHDLQPLAMPEHFSPLKLEYLRRRLRPSVARSRVVTAVSRFAADDVVERLGADAASTLVTPPAVDPEPPDLGGAAGVDGPYFLFPAVTWPHKNHRLLLDAFARIRSDAKLVLTGGTGPVEDDVRRQADRNPNVLRLDRVDDARLDALYRGATALVFPSRYEAVGLPVLEAMARGCPVIAADSPGLAETVGAAGTLVPADDEDAWVDALRAGPDRGLLAAGRERVRAWAPAAGAAALVSAWSRAAG
jgi:alpha-1,3-rhamnosyl/mannosyltransferase